MLVTDFDFALYRTAQMAYDLRFDGATFLYSWPSAGDFTGYVYDRESSEQAEPYLRDFLDMVMRDTGARVHLCRLSSRLGAELVRIEPIDRSQLLVKVGRCLLTQIIKV
mgnify:CR=1 FL=1